MPKIPKDIRDKAVEQYEAMGYAKGFKYFDDLEDICDAVGVCTWEILDEDAEAMGIDFDDLQDTFIIEIEETRYLIETANGWLVSTEVIQ